MSDKPISLTAEEKTFLLGREFANLQVVGISSDGGFLITEVVLNGRLVALIGDPGQALRVYLGGTDGAEVMQ